jgi:hypothetical protein
MGWRSGYSTCALHSTTIDMDLLIDEHDEYIGVTVPVDEQADLEQLLEEHDCVPVFLQPELQVLAVIYWR